MIRSATLRDIEALVEIENLCFDTDRLSRRSFRYILTKANAVTLVAEHEGKVCGNVIVLFNSGTSLARLYSIAIHPEFRNLGLGRKLAEAAEASALEGECAYMRLEIRRDNPASIRLFEKMGYRLIGTHPDYYEDGMDALRYEKTLAPHLQPELVRVPYYQQTLDFTCGPAALMMAMHTLDESIPLERRLELRLWRESTTIFMTSGHGGCGPYGLALSAQLRGFAPAIYVKDEAALFVDSVRSAEKKEVIRLVQEDFREELEQRKVPINYYALSVADLKKQFEAGGIPVVLISSYRIYQEKFPHWVVVTGFDDHFIYVHDPFVDVDKNRSQTDCINIPIPLKEFDRMARYGRAGQRAALIVRKSTRRRNRRIH
ncbi:MAG: GNAT family N-acetyltransferase/peptidase C39 family protein [Thiogranum sp.]|nr:GNAT family N-acetyltransferase/peptidase C39 family protein [Thiogranum sp.]